MGRATRVFFAAVGWGTVLCLGASADQNAPASASAPDRALVDGTQRDLRELSAVQRGLIEAKAGSTGLALPDLQAPGSVETPPAPLSPRTQQRAAEELRRQRESRNWLLEAMRKPAPPGKPGDSKQERAEALAALLSRNGSVVGDETKPTLDAVSQALEAEEKAAALDAPNRKEAPKVDNPLDAFLSTWMTPRDFALLGSGRGSSENPVVNLPTGGELRAAVAPTSVPQTSEPAAARNPYLQDISAFNELASARAPAGVFVFTPPPPVAKLAPALVAPATVPPTATGPLGIPSKTTPADTRYQPSPSVDAKYFPQLKRF